MSGAVRAGWLRASRVWGRWQYRSSSFSVSKARVGAVPPLGSCRGQGNSEVGQGGERSEGQGGVGWCMGMWLAPGEGSRWGTDAWVSRHLLSQPADLLDVLAPSCAGGCQQCLQLVLDPRHQSVDLGLDSSCPRLCASLILGPQEEGVLAIC